MLAGIISEGTTVLLVEQDLARALKVAGRVICMLEGRIVLEGEAASLDRDQLVSAYFGLSRRHDIRQRSRTGHLPRRLLRSARVWPLDHVRSDADYLAHGDIAVLGAYIAYVIVQGTGLSPFVASSWPCR